MSYMIRIAILSLLLAILCSVAIGCAPRQPAPEHLAIATSKCQANAGLARLTMYADSLRIECKNGAFFWVNK